MHDGNTLLEILNCARWAPSGDNTQPWRFEIIDDYRIVIHGHDTRGWCLYDFEGRASHMAHGALLETIRIAATAHQLRAVWSQRAGSPDTAPIYDVALEYDSEISPDPLIHFIKTRTVQRRPMRMTPLTSVQREALRGAPGSGYTIQFFESFSQRYTIARLLWANAYIRLTCPEAYQVHKNVIEWGARFSKNRIPERAVGVDRATARLMHWVMQSWERVEFFNRYLLGTIAPRVQLDLLPALSCAGHIAVHAEKRPESIVDFVAAGVAMQRLWLTAAAQGLYLQPEMTPIIFGWYQACGTPLSRNRKVNLNVSKAARRTQELFGMRKASSSVFFCRVGYSAPPDSRSLRKELPELMANVRTV
jgi:nitroreductase